MAQSTFTLGGTISRQVVATRKVWVSPATRNPTEDWVMNQAKAFINYTEADLKVEMVTRDNDQIYKKGFDQVMESVGIRTRRLALRSRNTNVFVERFIQTIQVECMDHFWCLARSTSTT